MPCVFVCIPLSADSQIGVFKPIWLAYVNTMMTLKEFLSRPVVNEKEYIDGLKSGAVWLSKSQAGPGRKFTQPRDHFLAHLCRLSKLMRWFTSI